MEAQLGDSPKPHLSGVPRDWYSQAPPRNHLGVQLRLLDEGLDAYRGQVGEVIQQRPRRQSLFQQVPLQELLAHQRSGSARLPVGSLETPLTSTSDATSS